MSLLHPNLQMKFLHQEPVFTTSGPVTNIVPAFSTIITKSVIAGEYTAPPADGPTLAVICGITPDANSL